MHVIDDGRLVGSETRKVRVMRRPDILVIVVSDYAAGAEKSWNGLRGTLTVLAHKHMGRTKYR